jgi:predicted RNA-binding protein with PIN domain
MAELDWTELPEPVRARLAEAAAVTVGELPAAEVPAPLRRLARFTPGKRARLGARPLLGELHESPAFRTAVLAWWTEHRPGELTGPDLDPAGAAAGALLSGAPEAEELVAGVAEHTDLATVRLARDTALARADKLAAERDRLRAELVEAREAAREARRSREDELERLRKRIREQGMRVREAEDAERDARAELASARDGSAEQVAQALVERDRALERADAERTRAARAADQASGARRAARESWRADRLRLELLMDTLSGAVDGLRRELAAEQGGGSGTRPADLVTGAAPDRRAAARVPDAATLERLLGMPSVHLIVDGYNVSKTEYPELALFDQRTRLVGGLASVVARTGAEVTVVFDGAAVAAGFARHPRGVRVLFSEPGVLADDVIRDLVRAEPHGRPLVVASSDRAVAESVQVDGAHPMRSEVLLDLLRRY